MALNPSDGRHVALRGITSCEHFHSLNEIDYLAFDAQSAPRLLQEVLPPSICSIHISQPQRSTWMPEGCTITKASIRLATEI